MKTTNLYELTDPNYKEKQIPQQTNPSFDEEIEKYVNRMNYLIGMRTSEMVMEFWNNGFKLYVEGFQFLLQIRNIFQAFEIFAKFVRMLVDNVPAIYDNIVRET